MDVDKAYRLKRRGDEYEYAIVLVDRAPERLGQSWEVVVDKGEMIGLLFSCSLSADDLIAARGYREEVPTPGATPAP
jgi:hypothetical protein